MWETKDDPGPLPRCTQPAGQESVCVRANACEWEKKWNNLATMRDGAVQ